jgi:hypothetical protein
MEVPMARVSLSILTWDAPHLEEAIKIFNDRQESVRKHSLLSYKGKNIKVVSKEKSASWDEKNPVNSYDFILSYYGQEALFLFGQDFGQRKVFAIQLGTYGKEVVGG